MNVHNLFWSYPYPISTSISWHKISELFFYFCISLAVVFLQIKDICSFVAADCWINHTMAFGSLRVILIFIFSLLLPLIDLN